MIIDIFYYFQRNVNRKYTLGDFMEFTNTQIRKVIKHVSTCSLSLRKCQDRMLTKWDVLKSYFVSNFDLNDDAYDDEENDNKKSREKR